MIVSLRSVEDLGYVSSIQDALSKNSGCANLEAASNSGRKKEISHHLQA